MDATRAARGRRWLPPLLLLAALVGLAGGVLLGLTAATGVQRFKKFDRLAIASR